MNINYCLKHNIKDHGAISLEVPETTVNNPLYMYKDYYLNKGFRIETYKELVSGRESIIIRWNE